MKYRITVGNVNARIDEGNVVLADRLLTCEDPAKKRTASRILNLTDGLMHFVDRETATLPAGLVGRLVKRLEKRGHVVEVADEQPVRRLPEIVPDCLVDRDLRPYQTDAANAAITHRRGILWVATNGGKSSILAALVGHLFRQDGRKSLVVVPNGHLLSQTSKELAALLGPDIRVETAGDGQRPDDPDVLVGTFQTMAKAVGSRQHGYRVIRDFIATCGAVFVDEGHRANSASITTILKACAQAAYRIGMSGSVDKRDNSISRNADIAAKAHRMQLERYLGPVIARVTNEDLIELGVSAKPTVYYVTDRNAFGPVVKTGLPRPGVNPYTKVFDTGVVNNRRFNRTVIKIAAALLAHGKPPIVFSHSIAHLQALSEVATQLNVKHRVLYGNDPVSRRQRVLDKYADRQDFIILASTIFDEGISLPAIRALMLAGARKSCREVLQRVGRGLRRKEDDNTVVVVDFAMPHSTMLARHATARLATFEGEKFKIVEIGDIRELHTLTFS